MSIKSWSVILIVLGLALLAISLLADIVGVGAHPEIFGWKQIMGVGVGIVMVICGVVLLVTKRGGRAA
jgi:hypothetical protein